ncbi:MAG: glycosyltransferase family 4 protein [Mariprofundaceae bacterium]|nr:glycosyltransferase family 4 protein [Mariprofundaceae bacterium]
MGLVAGLTHGLFALCLVFLAVGVTWWMLRRVQIMDVPNERSSHHQPTPRGGGIAIVLTFMIGMLSILLLGEETHIKEEYFYAFAFSSFLIAAISFYDDISAKSFKVKLFTHMIAVVVLLSCGVVLDVMSLPVLGEVHLSWVGWLISFFWLLGLTNAYNFMDGIDGLAAGTAVIVSAFFAYITFVQGSHFIYICCYTIFAGALGFLFFNVSPARIFMGDVGSAFLGFTFATMAIIAARYDHSHTSFLVMPLLLFHFIFDTVFSMSRRILAGENAWQAHRTHLYQLCVQIGCSHHQVTMFLCGLCCVQGFAAVAMVNISGEARLFIFAPFVLCYALAAWRIIHHAKRHHLLD